VAGLRPEVRRSRMVIITSSAAASAARPQLDAAGTGVGVGAGVLANATEVESVVAVTCVPALPAVSLKSIVKATTPSVSPVDRSKVAVQLLPLTLVTVTDPTVEAASTVTVTVGAPIVLLAVNESVTVAHRSDLVRPAAVGVLSKVT
jgi:hypothetical protein